LQEEHTKKITDVFDLVMFPLSRSLVWEVESNEGRENSLIISTVRRLAGA
jgi:hypothetical protein